MRYSDADNYINSVTTTRKYPARRGYEYDGWRASPLLRLLGRLSASSMHRGGGHQGQRLGVGYARSVTEAGRAQAWPLNLAPLHPTGSASV